MNDDLQLCPMCASAHKGDEHRQLAPEIIKKRKKLRKKMDEINLLLENDEDLTDKEVYDLISRQTINKFYLIDILQLDELQHYYAGQLQSITPIENEVLRLKLNGRTEEDIVEELGISRIAVRKRMNSIQKKGANAVSIAQQIVDKNDLKKAIIKSDLFMPLILESVKKDIEKGKIKVE